MIADGAELDDTTPEVTFTINGISLPPTTVTNGSATIFYQMPTDVMGTLKITAVVEAEGRDRHQNVQFKQVVGVSRLRVDQKGPEEQTQSIEYEGVAQDDTPVWIVPVDPNPEPDEDNPAFVRVTADPEPNVRNEVLDKLAGWEVLKMPPNAEPHDEEDIRSSVIRRNEPGSHLVVARPGQDPDREHRAWIMVADLDLDWDANDNRKPDDEPGEADDDGVEDLPGLHISPRDAATTPPGVPDNPLRIAYWLLPLEAEGERRIKVQDPEVARLYWRHADGNWTDAGSEITWDHNSPPETRQLHVESRKVGSTRIRFTLHDNALVDEIGLIVGDVNLTAYRPYSQNDTDERFGNFQSSTVPDEDEEDDLLGPGIRLDGDDPFLWASDDDAIRVDVEVTNDNADYKWTLSQGLQLYEDRALEDQIDTSEAVAADDLPESVYVRRTDAEGLPALPLEISLRVDGGDPDGGDTIRFHQFTTAVLLYMGANQTASDPPKPNQSFSSIAIALYNAGFDVHMFNEDYDAQLDLGQWTLPFVSRGGKVLIESARENGYTGAALLGYSRGGGSVYETSVWNFAADDANPDEAGPGLNIVQSVYFDAVRETEVELLDPEGGDDRDNQRVKWWRVEKTYPEEPIYWKDEAVDVKDGDGRSVVRANPEERAPSRTGSHSHAFQAPATWPADNIYELDWFDIVLTARGGPLQGTPSTEGWLPHIERHGEFDELVDEKKAVIRQFLDAPGVPR